MNIDMRPTSLGVPTAWISAPTGVPAGILYGPGDGWSLAMEVDGCGPVALLRRSFEIDHPAPNASLRMAATGPYKVYVNGRFVADGAPRKAPGVIAMCTYKVDALLTAGANCVAVELYGATGQKSLSLQIEDTGSSGSHRVLVSTADGWRYNQGPWLHNQLPDSAVPRHNPINGIVSEVYRADLEPVGWKTVRYDDSHWSPAVTDPVVDGAIDPSTLPEYVRTRISPARVVSTGEVLELLGDTQLSAGLQMATEIPRPVRHNLVEVPEDFPVRAIRITPRFACDDLIAYDRYWNEHDDLPLVYDATVVLDFGTLVNGFLSLDVDGNAGAIIDMAWGQTLVDDRVLPILYCRGREDLSSRPNQTLANRYVLRDGRQQWESFHWQSVRFVQLTFRRLKRPLTVYDFAVIASGQPLSTRGTFSCSDQMLARIFAAGERTLRACTYDSFMDNTIREKTIWGGDITDGAVPTCLMLFGDVPVLREYFSLFVQAQLEDGRFVPYIGADPENRSFFSHLLKTVNWMIEYAFWCADYGFYSDTILPAVDRALEYLLDRSRADARGLFVLATTESSWVDWCTGMLTPGDRSHDSSGTISVPVNLMLVKLYRDAGRLCDLIGRPTQAGKFRVEASRICAAIDHDFWDEQGGVYLDGASGGVIAASASEHGNALAMLAGLGSPERRERVARALKNGDEAPALVKSGVAFTNYFTEGLFALGDDAFAFGVLRERFSRFSRGATETFTFAENWSWLSAKNGWATRYRSIAQNGTGSPGWFFLTHTLGVRPTAVGFREFEIDIRPGDLEWAGGSVPCPYGEIGVDWKREGTGIRLTVSVPAGTIGYVASGSRLRMDPGIHTISVPVLPRPRDL